MKERRQLENKLPYSIIDIRNLCTDETVIMTNHVRARCVERNILYNDIVNTIQTGEIIESYPEDYPFPSCLICGASKNIYIHVVLSTDMNFLHIITAYHPNDDEWENDFKSRKRGNEQ